MEQLIAILLTVLPACQYEDSTYCVWDAAKMGNGNGASFVALGEDEPVIYLEIRE
jgi:hypothetical protein